MSNSKFEQLITDKYTTISEQGPVQLQPGAPPGPPVAGSTGGPIAPDVPAPEPEVQQLSAEGEVELVRLIRKALVLEPGDGEIPSAILDGDINEENSRSKLSMMKKFINTYSEDPDIGY
mgnify:CR=1 FL=1